MEMSNKGVRGDPHLKNTMKECQKVKKMLEAGAASEQISPQDYVKMLENLIAKDLLLI